VTLERPENYTIEMGPMGPIGEGEALILRVSRNCPWNQCLFCPVYKGKRFSARSVEEIKRDIEATRRVCNLLNEVSWDTGFTGSIEKQVVETLIRRHPEIYGQYPISVTETQWLALESLSNVANWMLCGAKRVFLQDANALFMKSEDLIEVLQFLKKSFPTIETITCYARSKTCERKSSEELKELRDAGLSWCFVGIESGCDDVLNYMRKGVKGREHISGGQKIMDSGIRMAAFVMPGLAGNNKELMQRHVHDTLTVLNEVRPTEVRVRSLAILESAPLYTKWEAREFEAPSEDQMIDELRMLLEGLRFDCTIETLQMTNVFTMKGRLSEKKRELLEQIGSYQALPLLERARFLLDRYLYGGYLTFVKSWGKYDLRLNSVTEEAEISIGEKANDAMEKVEKAIFAIRSKGIP
jgi:hypothetical protein